MKYLAVIAGLAIVGSTVAGRAQERESRGCATWSR